MSPFQISFGPSPRHVYVEEKKGNRNSIAIIPEVLQYPFKKASENPLSGSLPGLAEGFSSASTIVRGAVATKAE